MLQGDVEIGGDDVGVLCHGLEQAGGDLVRVGIEEAKPLETG